MSILKKILLGISTLPLSIASVGCVQVSSASPTSIQETSSKKAAYSSKIFDTSYVHTIDIEFNEADLQDLLEHATDETFYSCSVTIDGETFNNVGVITKGAIASCNNPFCYCTY